MKEKICLNCNGTGWHTCATCNGTGTTTNIYVPEYGKASNNVTNCFLCNGTGKKRCGCCYGTGYITEETIKKNKSFLKKLKKHLKGKAV